MENVYKIRLYYFNVTKKVFLFLLLEPTIPKIATSDTSVSWYNRERRILPVGGTVEVLSGTEVTLTCKYSAFPKADVKWSAVDQEGDSLPDAVYEVVNGSLVLMALQPSDSARYVCSVQNVAGTASASTILKVVGKYFIFLNKILFLYAHCYLFRRFHLPCRTGIFLLRDVDRLNLKSRPY